MGLCEVLGPWTEEEVLLWSWPADPGLQELASTASSLGKRGQDEWRRPASFTLIISFRTIWEVALTSKESDGLGKHLGPLSPVRSQQQEADVWGWRLGGFQSAGVEDSSLS